MRDDEITALQRPVTEGLPPRPGRDMLPWLATLGVLAVAGVVVWLFVLNGDSGGGQAVPTVVGMQQQQAIARLNGDGFDVSGIVGPASEPRGIVVSQKPGGGSRLDKGQTVAIRVSNGQPVGAVTQAAETTTAAPTATSGATTAQVPDVTGQDAASGAGRVEAAGFVAQTDPVDATGTAGTIVQQLPAAGAQAAVGGVVILSIAVAPARPAQPVPDVVGLQAGAARAALLAAKLTAKTEYRKGAVASVGVVLSQAPAGGGSAPAYTQVTIVVGL